MAKVCEFARTYGRELPDFVCTQTTTIPGPHTTTVLNEEVTFEKGLEHYSKLTVDSNRPTIQHTTGVRFASRGELGTYLVDLFEPPIVAEFKLRKEAKLRKIPASVYEFRIAAKKNTFWRINDGRTALYPEYEGKLWLRPQDERLLQLEARPVHLPYGFRFSRIDTTIDYNDIAIAGAGTFLLPSASETTVCAYIPGLTRLSCTTNSLVFHDCRKFATKSRIITDNPQP